MSPYRSSWLVVTTTGTPPTVTTSQWLGEATAMRARTSAAHGSPAGTDRLSARMEDHTIPRPLPSDTTTSVLDTYPLPGDSARVLVERVVPLHAPPHPVQLRECDLRQVLREVPVAAQQVRGRAQVVGAHRVVRDEVVVTRPPTAAEKSHPSIILAPV